MKEFRLSIVSCWLNIPIEGLKICPWDRPLNVEAINALLSKAVRSPSLEIAKTMPGGKFFSVRKACLTRQPIPFINYQLE